MCVSKCCVKWQDKKAELIVWSCDKLFNIRISSDDWNRLQFSWSLSFHNRITICPPLKMQDRWLVCTFCRITFQDRREAMIRAKPSVCVVFCAAGWCLCVFYNLQLEKVNLSAAQTLRAAFIKVTKLTKTKLCLHFMGWTAIFLLKMVPLPFLKSLYTVITVSAAVCLCV